jgi:hypothetical protein
MFLTPQFPALKPTLGAKGKALIQLSSLCAVDSVYSTTILLAHFSRSKLLQSFNKTWTPVIHQKIHATLKAQDSLSNPSQGQLRRQLGLVIFPLQFGNHWR